MKEMLLFVLPNCPHCKLALRLQEELFAAHPDWRDVPLTIIDEQENPTLAGRYDYYYVPSYFVDGVKVHEGHAEQPDVERAFRAAL